VATHQQQHQHKDFQVVLEEPPVVVQAHLVVVEEAVELALQAVMQQQ
jgi:hypothetical protein